MKSNAIHAGRTSFVCILLAVVLMSFTTGAAAQEPKDTTTPGEPTVSYLGTNGEQVAFRLHYDNPAGKKFVVTILNGEEEVLFDQSYMDKEFGKIIKAPSDIGTLTFVIRNDRYHNAKKIRVDTNKRFVEEVLVTRL